MNDWFKEQQERNSRIEKAWGTQPSSASEDLNDIEKGFSSDLQKRFPNGGWRTINGAKVFVNGGKVVAGLGGFNKEIDKFFDDKKGGGDKKQSPKGESKEYKFNKITHTRLDEIDASLQRAGIDSTPDFNNMTIKIKDGDKAKVDKVLSSYKGDMVGNDHQKYVDEFNKTGKFSEGFYKLPSKEQMEIISNTKSTKASKEAKEKLQEQTKKATSAGMSVGRSFSSLSPEERDKKIKSFRNVVDKLKEKNKDLPQNELEAMFKVAKKDKQNAYNETSKNAADASMQAATELLKGKSEKKDSTPTLDTFKDIAKNSKDVEDFMSKVQKIKNVPAEVANEFRSKYGRGKTQREASVAFLKEHSDLFTHKPSRDITEEDKKYFKENKKEIMAMIDDDPFARVTDAIDEHKKNNKPSWTEKENKIIDGTVKATFDKIGKDKQFKNLQEAKDYIKNVVDNKWTGDQKRMGQEVLNRIEVERGDRSSKRKAEREEKKKIKESGVIPKPKNSPLSDSHFNIIADGIKKEFSDGYNKDQLKSILKDQPTKLAWQVYHKVSDNLDSKNDRSLRDIRDDNVNDSHLESAVKHILRNVINN